MPAQIDTRTSGEHIGFTRNLSNTGALLTTPSRFRIGEAADLTLQLDLEHTTSVRGRIVRLEVNQGDETGIWPFLMAVRFTKELPEEDVARFTESTSAA